MSNLVKVTGIKSMTDKNGREFKKVTVSQETTKIVKLPNGKEVQAKGEVKTSTYNAWKQAYLDDKPETGYDVEVGDYLLGSIETRNVEPYTIENSQGIYQAQTYTAVVLGDTEEPSFENKVARVFKSNQHPLLTEEGEVLDSGYIPRFSAVDNNEEETTKEESTVSNADEEPFV